MSVVTSANINVSQGFLKELEKKTTMINLAKAYMISGDVQKADSFLRKVLSLYSESASEHRQAVELRNYLNGIDKELADLGPKGRNKFRNPESADSVHHVSAQGREIDREMINSAVRIGFASNTGKRKSR